MVRGHRRVSRLRPGGLAALLVAAVTAGVPGSSTFAASPLGAAASGAASGAQDRVSKPTAASRACERKSSRTVARGEKGRAFYYPGRIDDFGEGPALYACLYARDRAWRIDYSPWHRDSVDWSGTRVGWGSTYLETPGGERFSVFVADLARTKLDPIIHEREPVHVTGAETVGVVAGLRVSPRGGVGWAACDDLTSGYDTRCVRGRALTVQVAQAGAGTQGTSGTFPRELDRSRTVGPGSLGFRGRQFTWRSQGARKYFLLP